MASHRTPAGATDGPDIAMGAGAARPLGRAEGAPLVATRPTVGPSTSAPDIAGPGRATPVTRGMVVPKVGRRDLRGRMPPKKVGRPRVGRVARLGHAPGPSPGFSGPIRPRAAGHQPAKEGVWVGPGAAAPGDMEPQRGGVQAIPVKEPGLVHEAGRWEGVRR